MCTGIALYDTEHISPAIAFEIGRSFFEAIGVPVTGGSYYEYLIPGDHEGDHDLVEVSLDRLKEKIFAGEADSFWLYCERKGSVPWHAAFSRQTGGFGSFPHLAAMCEFPPDGVYIKLTDWLKDVAERAQVPYGVLYAAGKMTNTYYYAGGDNGTALFPYENGFAFKHETPGLYNGEGRYVDQMLRMVYPCNLLNSRHLNMVIDGVRLEDWITGSQERGLLTRIGNDQWMWEVGEERLDSVNQACGEAGLLVAWKSRQPKKTVRKLP
ncbi:hypothetical protein NYE69_08600 [Paenibacillus sp. FSL R5-0527]|uniref:hypothetical protein n=1 Tax=Paenibacillus sp. FSL R5-0527 TaxID=2975321 RepID=UPI00097AF6AC|nr:hypothetical protein BK140_25535 [Paenibacillus macerans]